MICKPCGKEYTKDHAKQSMCKECTREYNRNYHKNRDEDSLRRKKELQDKRRKETTKNIFEYLSDKSCEQCGINDPIVLEFDHLDQNTKSFNISDSRGRSWRRVLEEISKCRILCCNCHRKHTAEQLGWYTYLSTSSN